MIRLLPLLFLTSCTGVKYAHLSNPEIANDGHDLIGPYQEFEFGHVEIELSALYDTAPNHGWYMQGELKYRWKDD